MMSDLICMFLCLLDTCSDMYGVMFLDEFSKMSAAIMSICFLDECSFICMVLCFLDECSNMYVFIFPR